MKQFKYYLFFAILLLICNRIYANSEADSLKNIIHSYIDDKNFKSMTNLFIDLRVKNPRQSLKYENFALSLTDESTEDLLLRGYIYKNMGQSYLAFSDCVQAVKFLQRSLKIFRDFGIKEEIARAYNNLGIAKNRNSQFKTALKYYNKSLEIKNEIGEEKNLISTYTNLGQLYRKLGDSENSLKMLETAESIVKKYPEKRKYLFSIYGSLGLIYNQMAKYETAMKYYYKTLALTDSLDYQIQTAGIENNIANLNKRLKNYDLALKYFKSALEKYKEVGDKRRVAGVIHNMATIYRHNQEYSKAMETYEKALESAKELDDMQFQATIFHNMGSCLDYQGKIQEALILYHKSYKIAEEHNFQGILTGNLMNIGNVNFKLGNYQIALETLNQSLKIADELGNRKAKRDLYKLLVDLFTKTGKLKKALEIEKKYIAIKDSILNEKTAKQINEIQIKYQTEKNKLEIKDLKHEKTIQEINLEKEKLTKKIYFLLIGILFLTVIIVINFLRIKHQLAQKLDIKVAERTKALTLSNKQLSDEITERKKVESQLLISEKISFLGELAGGIAHKIRNPLTVIKSSAQYCKSHYASDENEIQELLQTIVDSADKADDTIVSLLHFASPSNDENREDSIINILENICQLTEGLRSNHNITLIKKWDDNLPPTKYEANQIEIMLMNLMINAIAAMGDNGTLTISVSSNDRKIVINIEDTGSGISPENLPKVFNSFFTTKDNGTGLGLSLVKEIVESYLGKIEVRSEVGVGTNFQIELPS